MVHTHHAEHGTGHHRGRQMRMRHRMGWRRGGPEFGRRGRGRMIQEFLADNPDCAEHLARYSVATMLEEGLSPDEIREYLGHAHDHGFMPDMDSDAILDD